MTMTMDTGGRKKFQGKKKRIRNRSTSDSSSAAAAGPMEQSNLDNVKPFKKKISRRPRSNRNKDDNFKNSVNYAIHYTYTKLLKENYTDGDYDNDNTLLDNVLDIHNNI